MMSNALGLFSSTLIYYNIKEDLSDFLEWRTISNYEGKKE
jgi:hypothetical protein